MRTGQATTGRVIVAAATIMICVFGSFILSGQQITGEIGLGLAAAVLLDAFILRTFLVPALMHLSGRANWWLPGWLDRILPHLSIEPASEPFTHTTPSYLTPSPYSHHPTTPHQQLLPHKQQSASLHVPLPYPLIQLPTCRVP